MTLAETIGLYDEESLSEGFRELVEVATLLVRGGVVVSFSEWSAWTILERQALAIARARVSVEGSDARIARAWGGEGLLAVKIARAHERALGGP